ncbi:interleukin-1 receptor type 1 [Rhineura floridana]|uniref:interleukin-1 receptor type 1 n=1 Tax=Rhineura floridana TaxID=261503 RepID=UPI002AC8538B|nr:interleukin-1 receptor type 1 [Rhineura floridana]XP_061482803.1 interleukin-1 receptor type 1 [Rhineura floridana]XP_061482804.1 interleukin-1 receptor type 1 [Rhineura floridana]XP_061482805.1 interleukin-1 receptor type 1 [Rhineura floridana]XP_061482806.1 interleukin-1 receptor type 1 [Rhineura floridana]
MISVLRLTCWICLVSSSFSICVRLKTYVLVGEPTSICCPLTMLASKQSNYTVTWYRNGSDIPITTNNYSRIHQQGNWLWFIPARIEDSGDYECGIQNSTRDSNSLTVFKNDDGLCYNKKYAYPQRTRLYSNGKLTCPDLQNFENGRTSLALHWFKACTPGLPNDGRFEPVKNFLLIKNVTQKDEGMYICQATWKYMGRQYNVSWAISLTLFGTREEKALDIIYPNNNSIEVELGSSVVMNCNASSGSFSGPVVVWTLNDEDLGTIRTPYFNKSPSGKLWIVGEKFNISEVKDKDYKKYFCTVSSSEDVRVVYLMLKPPALRFQRYLIGGLVSPLLVILAALLIYKFFKVDIVLWYRESCQILLSKGVSDGKLYDAYVLYPQNVTNCAYSSNIFVLKVLPEVLEKQCGYKLFIFGRDDLPGQAVVSVVDETMKRSRRVIIVLVPDSSCCSTQRPTSEHAIAVYSALTQDGIKVILIELDKIKDYNNMPESIKYLKEKYGVLTWKGDFSEKSLVATTKFWKNVRYQMPASKSAPSSEFHLLPVILKSS